MASIDDIERDDEEQADYNVGFQDRLNCVAYEGLTDEELFETKRTTVEQMWTRLEEVWRTNRNLGPGWSRGWKAAHEAQKAAGRI
jgi:hypothetical protein